MTREQFLKLFMAIVAIVGRDGDAVMVLRKQDLIYWREEDED
jgi:hypothetical protein